MALPLGEYLFGAVRAGKCFQFCVINKCCDQVSTGIRKTYRDSLGGESGWRRRPQAEF